MQDNEKQELKQQEEKSFFQIIVHSFFIIPFLIAVFCLLLFAGMHLLTREKRDAYDYLEDVKTGGSNKRWQGAFELSKILSNPKQVPGEERFLNELVKAFEESKQDDSRVRQYLALAMARTGNQAFVSALMNALKDEKEQNLTAVIYSLGMLKDQNAASALNVFAEHNNPRIRSITMVALGNIANPESVNVIKKGLNDIEPNVQWGAALSLVKLKDSSGKEIITKLLNREYLENFSEVDQQEKINLILSAIEASIELNDPELLAIVKNLSQTDQNMKIRAAALEGINR